MANYTIKDKKESNGKWSCTVTVRLPDMPDCPTSKDVSFSENSEIELDDVVTRFVISISNNL